MNIFGANLLNTQKYKKKKEEKAYKQIIWLDAGMVSPLNVMIHGWTRES